MKHAHLSNEDNTKLAWVIRNMVKFYKRHKRPKGYSAPFPKGEVRCKTHAEVLELAREWVGA